MSEVLDSIVDYLVRNRVSTTEVADCLGKTGVISGLLPCNQGYYKAGVIQWVYAYDESNWPVHEQIQNIKEDSIVFVDTLNWDYDNLNNNQQIFYIYYDILIQ